MARFAWVLAVVIAAVGPLLAQTSSGEIVPGQAIGGARIGMAMDDAAQVAQGFGQTRD